MTTTVAGRPTSSWRTRWARATSAHPEWWLVGAIVAAWGLLVLGWPAGFAPAAVSSSMSSSMPAGVHHAHGSTGSPSSGAVGVAALLGAWLVMVVAMMGPGLLAEVRHLAFTSLGSRRNRSVAWFLVGYAALWAALGVLLAAVVVRTDGAAMGVLDPAHALAGYLFLWALVVGWQLGAPKRRALRRCLRSSPVRGKGRAADLACARAGATNSLWCAAACGPAMLALVLAGHPPALAVALTAGLGAEKALAGGPRLVPWVGLGIAVVALAVALAGVLR